MSISRIKYLENEFRAAGQRMANEVAEMFPVGALIHVRGDDCAYTVIKTPEPTTPDLILTRCVECQDHVTFADWKDCKRVPS